jgi:hypothetical protein
MTRKRAQLHGWTVKASDTARFLGHASRFGACEFNQWSGGHVEHENKCNLKCFQASKPTLVLHASIKCY